MRITAIFSVSLLSTFIVFAQLPVEVKEATTKMGEIMENPSKFLDVVDGMSYENKVLFIEIVDKAVRAYPSSDDEMKNRIEIFEKYYYVSTNTPYLNVPIVVTPHQIGFAINSEVKFNSSISTNVLGFSSSHSNISYRINQNTPDFSRSKDSDILLIENDYIRKRNPYFSIEPMKYPGQY